MWILVGGRISEVLVNNFGKNLEGEKFQAVENVLDIVNTIFVRGVDHFEGIKGVVVIDEGCTSIVDLGWVMQMNRLGVPIIYVTTLLPDKEVESLNTLDHVTVVKKEKVIVGDIITEIKEKNKREGEVI